MKDVPDVTTVELRKFGYAFGGLVGLLFGILLPWLGNGPGTPRPVWPWVVLGVFAVWATAAPATLRPLYRLMMGISRLLNAVISPVLLGIVFFLVVLPTGIIVRLRGGDPMRREFRDAGKESYRIRSHNAPPDQMEKPF